MTINWDDLSTENPKVKKINWDDLSTTKPEPSLGKKALNTAKALGEAIYDLPVNTKGYIANLAEGSRPLDENNWADQWAGEAKQRQQEREAEGNADDPTLFGTRGDWRNTAASIPFSLGSMGGAAAGGVVGAPGGPVGSTAGGLAGAGGLAYRADSAMFVRQALEKFTQDFTQANGRAPNQQELLAEQERLQPYAKEHGLWEAAPEAVGSVIGTKLLSPVFKETGGKAILTKALKAGAGIVAEELPTETVTQMGQQRTESAAGLSGEQPRQFDSAEDWGKSLGEVAVPVVQQSMLMGGGAAGGRYAYNKFKKPSGPLEKASQAAPEVNTPTIDDHIAAAAEAYGLPPDYLSAIAQVESGKKQFDANGNPTNPGTSSALGTMQIIHKWHPQYDKEKLANDAEYNVHAGAEILRDLLDKTDPSLPAAERLRIAAKRYYGHPDDAKNEEYANKVAAAMGQPMASASQQSGIAQPGAWADDQAPNPERPPQLPENPAAQDEAELERQAIQNEDSAPNNPFDNSIPFESKTRDQIADEWEFADSLNEPKPTEQRSEIDQEARKRLLFNRIDPSALPATDGGSLAERVNADAMSDGSVATPNKPVEVNHETLPKQQPNALQSQSQQAPGSSHANVAQSVVSENELASEINYSRGKGLAASKWIATKNGFSSNPQPTKEDALNEVESFISADNLGKARAKAVKANQEKVVDKIKKGEALNINDIEAAFPDSYAKKGYVKQGVMNQFIADNFGISSKKVTPSIGDAAGHVTSDGGVRYPVIKWTKLHQVLSDEVLQDKQPKPSVKQGNEVAKESANDILSQTEMQYIKAQVKAEKLNPKSPGYIQRLKAIKAAYPVELDKALARSSFETYAAHPSNKGVPENLLRQGYEALQQEHARNESSNNQANEKQPLPKTESIQGTEQGKTPKSETADKQENTVAKSLGQQVSNTDERQRANIRTIESGTHPIVAEKNKLSEWVNNLSNDDYKKLAKKEGDKFPNSIIGNTAEPLKQLEAWKSYIAWKNNEIAGQQVSNADELQPIFKRLGKNKTVTPSDIDHAQSELIANVQNHWHDILLEHGYIETKDGYRDVAGNEIDKPKQILINGKNCA